MSHDKSRRALLKASAAGSLVSLLPTGASSAVGDSAERLQQAMAQAYGATPITEGRVSLKVPPLAENGNSVAVTVAVESAMTAADRVTDLSLFAAANPLPLICRIEFGPMAAAAQASFRVRLADSQRLTAVARMHDGTLWSGTATTIVTLAACTDFLF